MHGCVDRSKIAHIDFGVQVITELSSAVRKKRGTSEGSNIAFWTSANVHNDNSSLFLPVTSPLQMPLQIQKMCCLLFTSSNRSDDDWWKHNNRARSCDRDHSLPRNFWVWHHKSFSIWMWTVLQVENKLPVLSTKHRRRRWWVSKTGFSCGVTCRHV